jgi:hypothetical protein
VTGDLLAAAWTAADPLGGSLRERIHGCQLCCLGLEACFGLSLLGADTGQIGLQLPEGGRHMGQDAGEREYRPGLWMIQFTALDSQRATRRPAADRRRAKPDRLPTWPNANDLILCGSLCADNAEIVPLALDRRRMR